MRGDRGPGQPGGERTVRFRQIEPEPGGPVPVPVLDRDRQPRAQPVEQGSGAPVSGRGRRVLLVGVGPREHVHHQVEVVLQTAPDRVPLRDEHRPVLVTRQVKQCFPEHPRTTAVDQDAVLDRLAGDSSGAQELVQFGTEVTVRRDPVDHPAQYEVDVPAHHGRPVHRPLEPGVRRQPAEPVLHPAHHDADVEALQNTPQFTTACRTRTGRGKHIHGPDPSTSVRPSGPSIPEHSGTRRAPDTLERLPNQFVVHDAIDSPADDLAAKHLSGKGPPARTQHT